MIDDNDQHEPPISSKSERVHLRSNNRDPVLLSEEHREKKVAAPYLYIILIIVSLAAVFWKLAVRKDMPDNNASIMDQKAIDAGELLKNSHKLMLNDK